MRPSTALAILALLAVGCGPAPYVIGPEDQQPTEPPATVEVPRRGPEERDHWVPETFPRPNPFVQRRTWSGVYDCPQGRTNFTLRVIDARDQWVRAIFDFHHAPSDAAGQYFVAGNFDPTSGRVRLEPGPWINQPENYETVGMDGQISVDGRSFSGRITHPSCGMFRLRPVDSARARPEGRDAAGR